MNREESIKKINSKTKWDLVIIGGGATGLGIALDATTRGLKTLLIEKRDFSSGTSSRSTKLIHGGVRYLKQFKFKLVFEAIKERKILLKNAPHLSKTLPFIIPIYSIWEGIYFAIGLYIYEILSIGSKIGRTKILSVKETINKIPYIKKEKLKGGILYYDGQFNDSQLCIDLADTASKNGATIINYFEVKNILKENNKIYGIGCLDKITEIEYFIECRILVNATGVFSDNILEMESKIKSTKILPSQGIHLVLNSISGFSENALMIPIKKDNRVVFLIPWLGKIILGTTDSIVRNIQEEPEALEEEVELLINTYNSYSDEKITKKNISTVFAGLRPLIQPSKNNIKSSKVSREHLLIMKESGLISIIGGKWTTYRKMAELVVNKVIEIGAYHKVKCKTKKITIGNNVRKKEIISEMMHLNNEFSKKINENYTLTIADILYSIDYEMAINLDDILARRNRLLFLDANASIQLAPIIAKIMSKHLHKNENWEKYQINKYIEIANLYLIK